MKRFPSILFQLVSLFNQSCDFCIPSLRLSDISRALHRTQVQDSEGEKSAFTFASL